MPSSTARGRRADPRRARAARSSAAIVEPMLSHAISPTMIEASQAAERHPCALRGRLRLPPAAGRDAGRGRGRDPRGARRGRLRARLDRGRRRDALRRSTRRSGDAIESFVEAEEPGAALAPIVLAGFTDSHFLREAFGTIAYGFFPMRAMDSELAGARSSTPPTSASRWTTSSSGRASSARGTYTRRVSRDKVRLGGMALANGVLVHGPRYWACAVRLEDGGAGGRLRARSRCAPPRSRIA